MTPPENYMSASAAVSAIRPTKGSKGFTPETAAAVTAATCTGMHDNMINKLSGFHLRSSALPKSRPSLMLRRLRPARPRPPVEY